ncbi:hypothetical protein V6N11_065293 [Hibiscus sabdariffa]|uniref:Reverse transcriptase zinc-binding domain-containing protein n=1 Tax=Hibiscus sabdariffa TaxID=183260 RepID=A0ABR2QH20_9ROSI
MVDDFGQWKWQLFKYLLPMKSLLCIAEVKTPFGVQFGPNDPIWKMVVGFRDIPHIKLLLSLLYHEKLLTNVKCNRRHLTLDLGCVIYGAEHKDIDHILWWCPSAFMLGSSLIRLDLQPIFFNLLIKDWCMPILPTPVVLQSIVFTEIFYSVHWCGVCGFIGMSAHLVHS